MPKQIFINARFLTQPVTGVQRYAHELIKALDFLVDQGEIDIAGYKIELLAPKKGILHHLELKHITVRKVGYLSGHAWEQVELPFYSKKGLLFCPGNTAPVLSLLSKQLTVVTVHSLSFLYFPEAYSWAFKTLYKTVVPAVLRLADAVITVSESEKKLILQEYGWAKGRLYAIQNGAISEELTDVVDSITFDQESLIHPFILFVGSISRGKNLKGVLDAMKILNNDLRLVVAGSTGKTFKRLYFSESEDIQGKVEFKGQVDDPRELAKLYRSALCLVFPSFYESSGLPPSEAMTCGCPVIVSAIPALIERCGDAALYCNPGDPSDIADKIHMLMSDDDLRENLRQKGLVRARQFTWENCARETFAMIKELLAC